MSGRAGVVLAGGIGSRMRSKLPKVLHKLCGREMLLYPVETLREALAEPVVVVVSPSNEDSVRSLLGDSVEYVVQHQPLGTGHALLQTASALKDRVDHIAVIGGDTPLVRPESVKSLLETHLSQRACMSLLVHSGDMPQDMGRLARQPDGRITGIVEAAESNGTTVSKEVNGGTYWFRASWLWTQLTQIPIAGRGEFYLTSLAEMAFHQNLSVEALEVNDPSEILGINDRIQMATAVAALYARIREDWMRQGVTMIDPTTTFIDASAQLGQDTLIYPNTMVLGPSRVGAECTLGPGSVIRDSQIGDRCRVTASHVEGSILEEDVEIGPFSHLRPGSYIERGVHLGNFCEVKNSRLGQGSAMGHFGYLGDATVGAGVNLGAGAVTCNYDGVDHHNTVIEDGAFIGSDTMLVAPVRVGENSITAAGSVVTSDVPPARLAIGMPAKIRRSKRLSEKKRYAN